MKIELIGEDVAAPSDVLRRLAADIGLPAPEVIVPDNAATTRADPFSVAVGLAGLVLMFPPAVDATINLIDRARRDTARKGVDDLKAALEASDAESIVTLSNGRVLILPKAATDTVVDALLAEAGASKSTPLGV